MTDKNTSETHEKKEKKSTSKDEEKPHHLYHRHKKKEHKIDMENFPVFASLTEKEKVEFFKTLAVARNKVEKSGKAPRLKFGTVHDEYLQYLESGNLEESPPSKTEVSYENEKRPKSNLHQDENKPIPVIQDKPESYPGKSTDYKPVRLETPPKKKIEHVQLPETPVFDSLSSKEMKVFFQTLEKARKKLESSYDEEHVASFEKMLDMYKAKGRGNKNTKRKSDKKKKKSKKEGTADELLFPHTEIVGWELPCMNDRKDEKDEKDDNGDRDKKKKMEERNLKITVTVGEGKRKDDDEKERKKQEALKREREKALKEQEKKRRREERERKRREKERRKKIVDAGEDEQIADEEFLIELLKKRMTGDIGLIQSTTSIKHLDLDKADEEQKRRLGEAEEEKLREAQERERKKQEELDRKGKLEAEADEDEIIKEAKIFEILPDDESFQGTKRPRDGEYELTDDFKGKKPKLEEPEREPSDVIIIINPKEDDDEGEMGLVRRWKKKTQRDKLKKPKTIKKNKKEEGSDTSVDSDDFGYQYEDDSSKNYDLYINSDTSLISEKSEVEEECIMLSDKVLRPPVTKIRTLQDLLKDRAVFVVDSADQFIIQWHPPEEYKYEDRKGDKYYVEDVFPEYERRRGTGIFGMIQKICTCNFKDTEEEDAFTENLKGESIAVEVSIKAKDVNTATLDDNLVQVLESSRRRRLINMFKKNKV